MKILVGLGVALAIITGLAVSTIYYKENTHYSCEVVEKDRTKNEDGSSDARVYTENCGVFVVEDTLIKGQFNSADTVGSIKEGGVYNFTTIGFRNGVFSMFPNIIEAVEVKSAE